MSNIRLVLNKGLNFDALVALWAAVFCAVRERFSSFDEVLATGKVAVHFEDEKGIPPDASHMNQPRYTDLGFDSRVARVLTEGVNMDGQEVRPADCMAMMELKAVQNAADLLSTNNQSGYLKDLSKYHGTLVWLILEMFKSRPATRRIEILNIMWPVLEAYVTAFGVDPDEVGSWDNPFTIANYAKMLEIIGMSASAAREACKPLQVEWDNAHRANDHAEVVADELQPTTTFKVRVQGGKGEVDGHHIVTNNTRVAGNYLYVNRQVCALLIERTHTQKGRYCIMFRGQQDVERLFRHLNEREPGRWNLHQTGSQSPVIQNGSNMVGAPSSEIPPGELMVTIQTLHQHASRKMQTR